MKEIDSPEGRRQATDEFLSMFETMRNVKGKEYAAVVRGVFALCNYHEAMTGLGEHLNSEVAKEAFIFVHASHEMTVRDITKTLINQYMAIKGLALTEEAFTEVLAGVSRDIKMLSDKQNEYGAFAFGEPE